MKILFVCRQNIGRSQMAKELYNRTHAATADAAGTIVDVEGQTLEACHAVKTIATMKELGIDVSQNRRRQLTQEMLPLYDKVIVMSEPQNTPEWLATWPKAERWEVPDTKNTTLDGTREVRDRLATLVATLPT